MEERDRETVRTLYGHSGPVYKVAFDPFKTMLLSASEDSTGMLFTFTHSNNKCKVLKLY